MKTLTGILVWLALSCGSLLAQSEKQAPEEFSSDLGPALLKLLGALVLIVVVIYGSVWIMKRFSGARSATGGGKAITVLERHFLAPKQALYLIRVGKQHMLVGGAESGLRHIADIPAEDFAQPEKEGPHRSEESKFNKVLKQARQTFRPMLRSREASVEANQ